jgi:hypothetical protein
VNNNFSRLHENAPLVKQVRPGLLARTVPKLTCKPLQVAFRYEATDFL